MMWDEETNTKIQTACGAACHHRHTYVQKQGTETASAMKSDFNALSILGLSNSNH